MSRRSSSLEQGAREVCEYDNVSLDENTKENVEINTLSEIHENNTQPVSTATTVHCRKDTDTDSDADGQCHFHNGGTDDATLTSTNCTNVTSSSLYSDALQQQDENTDRHSSQLLAMSVLKNRCESNPTTQFDTKGSSCEGSGLGDRQPMFSPEQVACICEAMLQRSGVVDRLTKFLSSLPLAELLRSNQSILKARATVAFHQVRRDQKLICY